MLENLENTGIRVLNDSPIDQYGTIIVVGVPRSGTTMVARALSALGIYIGADIDHSVQEDLRIATAIESGNDLEVAKVVDAYNARHKVWAFKRPTAYQRIKPELFRNPRFVVVFRDPVSVAVREEISVGFDFRQQLRQVAEWSKDLVDFAFAQAVPTMLVSYEKALLQPELFVRELAGFVGARSSEGAVRAIEPSPRDYLRKSQSRFTEFDLLNAPAADVAVVIPYYNGSKYIERSVRSVLRQTNPPAEFVVVNDGSKAEEADFLHKLSKQLGFDVLDKENGGQGSARNAGVAATKSPYICLLDQDDYFLPNHIETLRAAVDDDERFGWAYADLVEADGTGQIIRLSMIKEHSSHPKTDIFRMIGADMFVLPSASIIARKAFEAVEGFDAQFMGYEDDDLFMRLFRAGFTNKFVDTPVTVWCINPESTSYSIRMSRSRWKFFKKVHHRFPSDPIINRFVLRDLLIPRFHASLVGEAFTAVGYPHTARGKMLVAHTDELIEILRQYSLLIANDEWIGRRKKLKLKLQTAIISTKSRLLTQGAFIALNNFRRLARLLRKV